MRIDFLLEESTLAKLIQGFGGFVHDKGVVQNTLFVRSTLRSLRLIASDDGLLDFSSMRKRLQEEAFLYFLQEMHNIDCAVGWWRCRQIRHVFVALVRHIRLVVIENLFLPAYWHL